jgi:Fe-S-cluster containining protein
LGLEYEVCVTEADVRRWREEGRKDILAWVAKALFRAEYDFPVDPETGDNVEGECPFLERVPGRDMALCSIHDTRPLDCARFPVTYEDAVRVGCEGGW